MSVKAKHEKINVPGLDPFKNCKLGRKKQAEILTSIVGDYKDGFVLAINNKWGHGKTTFVEMWKVYLGNLQDPFRTLYFNAWENDLDNSVFVALLSELKKELKPYETENQFNTVLLKAQPFLKSVIPGVAKAAASHWVGKEAVEAFVEGASEGIANALDKELDAYQEKKDSLMAFRDALELYVRGGIDEEEIEEEEGQDGRKNPVVFIIDELDRCRPDYAVTVLEQIKHLFSVPGIVFVLSIDKEQLAYAVQGVYGSADIDANEYLRRFIDLEYSLPEPDYRTSASYFFEYFKLKGEEKRHSEFQYFTSDNFIDYSSRLLESVSATLRQQEKLFVRMKVSETTNESQPHFLTMISFTLFFVEEFYPAVFKKIRNKDLTFDEMTEEMGAIFKLSFVSDNCFYHAHTVTILICAYNPGMRNKVRTDDQKSRIYMDNPRLGKLHLNEEGTKYLPELIVRYSRIGGLVKLWENLIQWNSLSGRFTK